MENLQLSNQPVELLIRPNTTTKAELFRRAKEAVDAGEQSLKNAADALGLAQEDHSASQREMAVAVGKSASWVNKLLKWRRSGYKDHSPFGPTTKRDRVEHAKQRAKVPKSKKASFVSANDADDLVGNTKQRDVKCAKQRAETAISKVTDALAGFKSAVDYWFPKMTSGAKREAVTYATSKGVVT